MSQTKENLLPTAEEPKLIDRPAEERLQDELRRRDGHAPNEDASEPPHPHHVPRGKVILVIGLMALIVIVVALAGYLPRQKRERAAAEAAQEEATSLPTVTVSKVRFAPKDTELLLPGSITPVAEASIFARASGYVRKRYVDIGDRVRAGQLIAEIETPELDQQVAQARATLAQTRQQLSQTRASLQQSIAQRDLAKVTWDRYNALVQRGAVARQDADTQESAYKTSEAVVSAQEANVSASEENVRAAQANLDRVIAMQEFQRVRAPFPGVITARNVDVGYLISPSGAGQGASPLLQSANGSGSGNEMFRVAQTGTLRILISVPQASAPSIFAGMPADVFVNEYPGRIFAGKVTRTTNSLDPNSRTLLTEVQVPNKDGKLLPGMYAQVRFRAHRETPPILVPGDAVIAGPSSLQLAVLEQAPQEDTQDPDRKGAKKIHLQTVQVGRDYGAETEITAGLNGSETVVVNPGDEVREGALVIPEPGSQTKGKTSGATPGSRSAHEPGGISAQSAAKQPSQQQSGASKK